MGFQYSNLMQSNSLTFRQKILIDGFNGLGKVVLTWISENPRSRFMLELMLLLCWFRVLKRVARSQLLRLFNDGSELPIILLFFRDFFWRSCLLEYWIRSHVRGHWFGCSLRPGTPLNSPCQEVGFICPFVVIDPTYLGAKTAIARNLLQD